MDSSQANSQKEPNIRKIKIKRDDYRKVVSYILTLLTALFIASFTFSSPSPLKVILGSCLLSLSLSLILTLDSRISQRQLAYVALLIPAFVLGPMLLVWANLLDAIQIGWSIAYVLSLATAFISQVRRLPWEYFLVLGLVVSQLIAPSSFVYRSVDNPHGLLDPWSNVEVYGNLTNTSDQVVNFTDSTHHSSLWNTVPNYSTGIARFSAVLPNRMNYTVSVGQSQNTPSSFQSCQPLLVLNVDSQIFAFNVKC